MKIVLRVFFVLVLLAISLAVFYKAKEVKEKVATFETKDVSELPEFSFTTLKDRVFTNKGLSNDKSLVVIYFNSGCEYCDEKAKQVAYYSKEFKNSIVLFISSEDKSAITKFTQKHKLAEYDNYIMLQSQNNGFYKAFGTDFIPAVLVFSSKGKLLVKIDDVVPIKTVIKYVRAANKMVE